jgi:hypothetical protein
MVQEEREKFEGGAQPRPVSYVCYKDRNSTGRHVYYRVGEFAQHPATVNDVVVLLVEIEVRYDENR